MRQNRIIAPKKLIEKHRNVQLFVDVMFINRIPFLHVKSESLKFQTSTYMNSLTKESLRQGILQVIEVYKRRKFNVEYIDADLQFECIENDIENVEFDIVDADDHVNVIERAIRTVKENIRSIEHGTPYRRMTRLMTKRMVEVVTRNLNMFPAEQGVSKDHSLLTIVTGSPFPDTRAYPMDFRAHVELFEDNRMFQNSNRTRSTPAIALGPLPYRRPEQIFMSLVTGKRLCRNKWTELPMPNWVIDRVHYMAQCQKQI